MALQNILDTPFLGVTLPAPSGTPGLLDYFEPSYAHNTTWSGPWASPLTANCSITRIGNIVTFTVPLASAVTNAATLINMDTVLPARFRPPADVRTNFHCQNNAAHANGVLVVASTGGIQIAAAAAFTAFTSGAAAGFFVTTASWLI